MSASPRKLGRSLPSAEVLRKVQRLELRTRGLVESLFSGEYLSIFHGRGMEFSHVRGYIPGDDVRTIDWRVTARLGVPYVKQYVEERDTLVVLVVDVSASGRLAPGDRSVGEVAAEIAGALAFAAARNHDRSALLLVSDRVEHFLPPGSGRQHTIRLLAELLDHRPQGKRTNLTPGLERVSTMKAGRATVCLISDFIQDRRDSAFTAALGRLARTHDLVAVRLISDASDELPDIGWVEMTDPESGRRIVIDTGSRRVRDRYRHSVHVEHAAMAALLTEVGAELVEVNTALDPLAPLADFFRRRQRAKS